MLHEFSYSSPRTKDELFSILREKGEQARIYAGGTDLLVDIRAGLTAPRMLIDVKKIGEYRVISFDEKEGLSIGAAAPLNEVIRSRPVQEHFPLIAEAAGRIGSPQIRNRATVGGNLCTASPSADMAPVLLCLDASVEIASDRGVKIVRLGDFFKGVKKTALEKGEVLQRVLVPCSMADSKGAMEKLKRIKGHDLSLVSVALVKKGEIMRIAIGACAPIPVVLKDFTAGEAPEKVLQEALRQVKPIDDVRASADYRRFMVEVYIERLMTRFS